MNVCFCTAQIPYPPIAGGRVETYRLVEGLVDAGHDVTVVAAGDPDTGAEMAAESGADVRTVDHDRSQRPGQLVRNLATSDPLPVMKFREGPYADEVRETLGSSPFDVLHLHTLQTSFLARDLDVSIPRVVRLTNVKSLIFRQFASYTSNPAKAAYSYLQYRKTRRYERGITAHADVTLAITNDDRDFLRDLGAPGRVETLPAGIDVSRFDEALAVEDGEPVVTFFGSMDYHPNEDAALWFTDEIWPEIRASHPEAALELVGKGPSEELRALADDPSVTVTGFVDDITEWVARASVVAIPIRVGTGVRIKILHAMAMGKPVVSTSAGIQGIEVTDGVQARVRDDPSVFAGAVTDLLERPEDRAEIGRAARTYVDTNHGTDAICENLVATYEEVR